MNQSDSFLYRDRHLSCEGVSLRALADSVGTPAYVYENPGRDAGRRWPKHEVFDWVSNESPHFTNLVGDDRPELVCTRDGYFGYAEVDGK